MINRLKLSNFKAWREADLQFGKITGFFGTNSAGKSSLLQLLLLLKQTKNATDRRLVLNFGGPSDLVNLGTFRDIVHHHDGKKRINWLIDWSLSDTLELSSMLKEMNMNGHSKTPQLEGDVLQTQCQIGTRDGRPWVYELVYRFDGTDFRLKSKPRSENKFSLKTNANDFDFLRHQDRTGLLSHPIKTHLFPDGLHFQYQNAEFLSFFELKYENLMDSIYYLGPLREYPQREYSWAGSGPDSVGQRGERTVDAILAATRDEKRRHIKYYSKKTFQEVIAHWLKKLGLIHEFSIEEIARGTNLYQAIVKTSKSSPQTALTDVGFGVSQVLPALVLLYYVPKGSTVLMEQPEIHLHPAVQSGLADVMLEVAKVRDVQIIVESHSEYLMRRLQRRVAEGKESPEDVRLYFVSTKGRKAQASDLSLNEWGEIENWPKDFFGDERGEIAAIAKASLKRKIESS